VFDAEAGKTTGLLERLRAERSRPVADVWWSSEIFGTVNLFSQGVLTPYAPRSAEGIPAAFRDGRGGWTAFGLRGRVVAFDPKRIARERVPTRWADYAAADIAHRTAIADPRFGTTRGHMAAMSVLWGDEAFQTWLSALADGSPHIAAGNAQTVSMVVRGQVDFGWTDTDDVLVAIRRGDSIDMIHPDLDSPGGEALPGTLWIPNSVGLVAGGPNPVGGRKLIEFIASADMERMLAASDSGNVPVRASIRNAAVPPPKSTRVDYSRVAQALRRTDELCREVLLK
jgi:iron(III) transport system substrate-binding protein